MSPIRPIALAVVRRRDDLLVAESSDPTKNQTFYRPPGGGIEFGERAVAAVVREMREELDVEVYDVAVLGVLENIFHAFGRDGHEIAFICSARVRDPGFYDRDEPGTLLDAGDPLRWRPLAALGDPAAPLYPTGLFDLLTTPTS